jgi:PAS domain-containing protein
MCVSNMRKLATRKAAAMVRAMPSAMVMVDSSLRILEANEAFVFMFTGEDSSPYLGQPEELTGLPVTDFLEFGGLLRRVLNTGQDIQKEHYLYQKRLYNVTVFSIERHQAAGAVVTDITSLKKGRESLARKVRDVITKNISTVQEIASLLGEHMVETESILSAIAADFEEEGQETAEEDEAAEV